MAVDRLSEAGREVRQHDHDRYLTALFAEPQLREELFALYALNYEIAKTAEVVSEAILGQIRLQWWRESLEGLFGGSPRQHHVLEALAPAAEAGRLPRAELERLIDAREQDLDRDQPRDLAAFEAYAEASGATLLRAVLSMSGLSPEQDALLYQAARHIGVAYATAGLLRAVPFHAARKQIFLPLDHMEVAGVDIGQHFELRSQESLAGVAMRLANRAQEHLNAARKLVSSSRRGTPVLLHGSLAQVYLKRLAAADYDVFNPNVGEAPPGRMPRLAWLSWRGRW